jgi:Ca-activated chloride channel homolog
LRTTVTRTPTIQLLFLLTLLAPALGCGRGVLLAQNHESQEGQADSTFSLKVNVDLVVLNFAVVDESGRSVVDLRQDDCSLYEDGVPQTITEFLPTTAPFNLALVLDTSSSVRPSLQLIQKAGIEFAQQLRPNDRIGIAVFNSSVSQHLDFTSDRKLLVRSLNSLTVSKFGGSKVYDGIAQAVYRLRELSTGRNAIVILSDGMENASRIKFDGLRLLLAQSDAVLYPVTILNKERQQDKLEAYIRSRPESDPYVANARASLAVLSEIYQLQTERLVTLARDSGGKVSVVSHLSDLAGEYAKIAQELRKTYSVAYYSTNPRRDGSLRTVRVEVKNPKYRIRTRSSYFVPKEE